MKFVLCLALTLLCGRSLSHAQNGATRIIATTGTAAPGLSGNFTSFGDAVLNGSGTVAFVGNAESLTAAVFKTNSSGLITIAATGQSAPVGSISGTFAGFSDPLLNENGTVAFFGLNGLSDANGFEIKGIYTASGGVLTTIFAHGQPLPGVSPIQNTTEFGTVTLSDSGRVAFKAIGLAAAGLFAGTGGGTLATTIASTKQTAPGIGGLFSDFGEVVQNNLGVSAFSGSSINENAGVYTTFGGTLNTIATTLQAAPVIGGNFFVLTSPTLNDYGTAAFTGISDNGRGIFKGSGGELTAIVTSAQAAPGLGTNFTNFFGNVFSNSGLVAFRGVASINGQGIYTGSGGALQTVATTLQTAPVIGGNFAGFGKLAMNDLGTVAFTALASSDPTSATRALYLGDGQELVAAAYLGQMLYDSAGTPLSTISSITFAGGTDRGGNSQINNNGQIAYQATLANGTPTTADDPTTLLLFTPTLHFRNPAGGSWAARNNWTVGILPASVHDVVIDPATALAINGPSLPTTVKSLAVGTGAGLVDLALQSSGTITNTGGVSTGGAGRILGNGKLIGNLTNAGTIAPGLPSASGSISVMGNVILQPTSHLALDLGGLVRKTGFDWLSVSGAFTLGGTLDVALLGGFAPLAGHSFDLFDAASTTGAFSLLNLPSLSAGLGWNTTLLASSGVISVISVGPVSATWNATGGGSWSASLAGNWNPAVPDGNGAVAIFGTAITAPATITADGAKTVGKLIFGNNAHSYTVAGPDSITLADSTATPVISVTLGTHTVSAPLVLSQNASASTAAGTALTLSGTVTGGANSLTKTGDGTLNLDGTQSYAALNATAGTTNVDGAVGAGTATVSVSGAGTSLKFGTVSQTLSSLTIGAGATVTFTSGAASFGADGGKAQVLGGSAAVPEPGSLGLLLTGVLGLLARRRRTAACGIGDR